MAQTITNFITCAPDAIGYKARVLLADQSADVAAQDMGVDGCKFLKVRMRVKALVGTFALRVNVDTVVGMSTPEYIIQSGTYADGEPLLLELMGWSEDGFRYVNLDVAFGTSGTFDCELIAN